MKRYYFGDEVLDLVCGDEQAKLIYYILENENDIGSFKEYGVEIQKVEKYRTEKSRVLDITTDESRINFIINLLMRNAVTPVHLHDIIEDLIC